MTKVFVAGHGGMVGSAIVRRLNSLDQKELVLRTRAELDLLDQSAVQDFFRDEMPHTVIFAAARVGGIHANTTLPADFLYENTIAALNTIHAAHAGRTQRFLFLGSTCMYPRMANQPIEESSLLSGDLEQTNEAYAIAKIAGVKYCQYLRRQYGAMFHSAVPTNLYGPGDNYHPENSHVLPALIRRFHQAVQRNDQTVRVWGSGRPRRDFLHVDDLAAAVIHLLSLDDPPDWVNVGTGTDCSILELANLVANIVGFKGQIDFDPSRPDGTPKKRTDISLLAKLGWQPSIRLEEGVKATYDSFLHDLEKGVLRT